MAEWAAVTADPSNVFVGGPVTQEVALGIVDTPGFQRPRQMLAWLTERASNAAKRPEAVRAFVDEHANSDAFPDEVELLRPIMAGACILYVVDASSLARGLYLTLELLETGLPVVVALNMMDVARKRGIRLDAERLSSQIGCHQFYITAAL